MGGGSDVDDTGVEGWCAGSGEGGKEKGCESEVGEVVDGELGFKAVGGESEGTAHDSGVVDKNVKGGRFGEEGSGAGFDGGEGIEVHFDGFELAFAFAG